MNAPVTRESIIAEARSRLGERWQHQARLKGVASDCIGYIGTVAVTCGVQDSVKWMNDRRCKGYGHLPNYGMLLEMCNTYLEPATWMKLANILLIRMKDAQGRILRDPSHFALISNEDPVQIIHSYAQVRGVTEHSIDADWTARVAAIYSFKGLWHP